MSQSLPSSPRGLIGKCPGPEELQGGLKGKKSLKRLCKQLSMRETARDLAWEKRRRQILRQGRMAAITSPSGSRECPDEVTDKDLDELKGCIELGFGFNEEYRQMLTSTLPALDIYFAVNRYHQTAGSAGSTLSGVRSSFSSSSSLSEQSSSSLSDGSPRSDCESWNWKICNPGDDPEQVKMKLRHWAQAVACSVRQSPVIYYSL
ncbi:hypothetical protein MLD38_010788 [Melastoma candidum]|uniref:Uncharacterized protein n=1 Tax=Melastoma candidum TaxID=119954 RepID=A0ACB9R1I9_9MYRT|nr:hypothetical protein MLD38_010788 [Melastoma candidum]